MPCSIQQTFFPASAPAKLVAPIVLLHGWGVGREIWQECLAQLCSYSDVITLSLPGFDNNTVAPHQAGTAKNFDVAYKVDVLLPAILKALPERCHLVGFSLGGMLALQLAEQEQVLSVAVLASNLQFVAGEDWPNAMAKDTFAGFSHSYQRDAMRTHQRFNQLQCQGFSDTRTLMKSMRPLQAVGSGAGVAALNLLGEMDVRSCMRNVDKPVGMWFGENDELLPVAAAEDIKSLCSSKNNVHIFTVNGGHCLPLGTPGLGQMLGEFFNSQQAQQHRTQATSYQLDKTKIARSFSRSAQAYDSVAGFQQGVVKTLMGQLPVLSQKDTVLDLGSGTGCFTRYLGQEPCLGMPGSIFNVDLAEGMLHYARAKNNLPDLAQYWFASDAENLALASRSVDLLFSSLAVQWCQQTSILLKEIKRVLKPGGEAYIATLGPDTLCELRQAWAEVDDYPHVNNFTPKEELLGAVEQANFSGLEFQEKMIELKYDRVKDITYELKTLGAHNMNQGKHSGLGGLAALKQMVVAYERLRKPCENKQSYLPVSYQLYIMKLTA